MGIGIDVRGIPEVKAALGKLGGPGMNRTLQKASSAGAKVLKPYVKAEAPVRTGRLRKGVSARVAKRDRPAAIVGHRKVFYWPMVVGGTKRGQRANPFVARGYDKGQTAALAAIDKVIADYLASI
jgi:hypothetical protein